MKLNVSKEITATLANINDYAMNIKTNQICFPEVIPEIRKKRVYLKPFSVTFVLLL